MKRQQFTKILCLMFIWLGANAICNIHAQEDRQSVDVTANEEGKVFGAHIQDAKTGEPLPYVSIYVASGIGTMTNLDGDFSIKTDEDADLRISYIGYRTVSVKAGRLSKTVKMEPVDNMLQEVVVLPMQSILNNIEKRLVKDYSSKKKKTSRYFYRQLVSTKNNELAEAFLEAKSAVNLRELTFLSGRHGRTTETGLRRPLIADMNFHHPLELGLLLEDVEYWYGLTRPFSSLKNSKKIRTPYSYTIEQFEDEGGKMYRISFERKDTTRQTIALTGTMYVDAKTYQVHSFDGKVEGMYLDVNKDFVRMYSPINLDVHIKYRHSKKYTEIENISYTMKSGDVSTNAILFNVDGLSLKTSKKAKKQKVVKENMLMNIDDAEFDNILSANADIVKRTDEEAESAENEDANKAGNYLTTRYNVKGSRNMKWTLDLPDNALGNHVNRLAKIGQIIPQEKVYVHMDNTSYFLGDSIWFSAYLRRTNDDQFSNISGILYVELLNHDGYLMERKMIDTKKGYGYGAFYVDPDWYAGYYELRAYTRWQLNWGITEHEHSEESKYWFINKEMQNKYYTDYEKLYSRVFPVYDAPKAPGQYNENMTLRQLIRYYKNDPDKPKLQLKLYPEGGELIYGVPCRIAYEATYTDGMFAKGNLTIDNGKGVEPTIVPTVSRGRGVFTITPKKGMSRNIKFVASNEDKASCKLPDIQEDGVAINVQRHDSLWTIKIYNAGNVSTDSLGLTIMHEGRVRYFYELNDTSKTIVINNDDLENGINQATIFDTQGRIYADRLFFVTRPELAKRALTVSGIKDEYQPYEHINLNVSMDSEVLENISNKRDNNSGFISLSVRDSETSNQLFDNASMQAEMLLSSEIRGFVPSPDWYFEKDDAEHQQALDLLMMTQGWRRFDWRKMAIRGEWDLTQPDERTPVITGKLYRYDPMMFYHPKDWGKIIYNEANLDPDPIDVDAQAVANGWAEQRNNIMQNGISEFATQKSDFSMNDIGGGQNQAVQFDKKVEDLITDYKETHRNLKSDIKPTVKIHAEVVYPESTNIPTVEMFNNNGKFRINMPKTYLPYEFFLSASDTTRWEKKGQYIWVQNMPDYDQIRKFRAKDGEMSIRIDQPYPRFVKPYSYYQQNLNFTDEGTMGEKILDDGTRRLGEVRVNARRGGYRSYNDTLPAFMVDAYEAYNYAMDAGMMSSDPMDIIRAYVSDYGLHRPYTQDEYGSKDYRLRIVYGADVVARGLKDVTLNPDSASLRRNLYNIRSTWGRTSIYWNDTYGDLTRIDKYVVYTDYQPRLEGSSRYYGSNLPFTCISIVPYADDSRRKYYRDRRFLFDGVDYPAEFYQPDYSDNRLPDKPDHRRTLYWNPRLPLDANGKATVSFWNNSHTTQIKVSAEGVANNGQTLSDK